MAAQLIPIPAALGVYPTLPEDFTVKRYVLPGTVERPEMEEAAARILHPSVLLGQWTGVSMAELYDELDEEKRTLVDNSRRLDADAKTLSRWKWAFTGYVIVAVVTVCIGLFFLRRPIRPASTVVPLPESGTFGQRGGDYVTDGLQWLIGARLVATMEGPPVPEGGNDVLLFPTPQLVEIALAAWQSEQ